MPPRARQRRRRGPPQRDWRVLVAQMTPLQRLIFETVRRDAYDEERLRTELFLMRGAVYEDELAIQAARAGLPERSAHLQNENILSGLNAESQDDAAGIVNTYNYDLALAIMAIDALASRAAYQRRLKEWEAERAKWKDKQVEEFTAGTARAWAQQDFYRHNEAEGYAVLRPETAVCPICVGWVARGKVSIAEALNNPGPWHPRCPHYWLTFPAALKDAGLVWMGE